MKARIKRIQINAEAFFHILQAETAWRVSKGVPKNARMRGASFDPYTMSLILLIEHESFPEVDVNVVAPLLETEFRKIV